jgi:hypothetical protein
MVASILGVPRVSKRCTLLQTRGIFSCVAYVEVLLAVMIGYKSFQYSVCSKSVITHGK